MDNPYVLHRTLDPLDNFINCLSFSTSGEYLATGGESGILRVWRADTGDLLHAIEVKASIVCLVWDPTSDIKLFCGCHDGVVVCIDNFGKNKSKKIQTGVEGGQAYALAIDDAATRVAIAVGPEIHVANRMFDDSFATFTILPEPAQLPNSHENSDNRIRGRGLQFMKHGTLLIVSYLNHGIVCWNLKVCVPLWTIVPNHLNRHIGSATLSPDCRTLLVSNLDTGMDLYSLETFQVVQTYQYAINPQTNFPLSVAFLKGGRLVVCGTHTNTMNIWDRASEKVQQILDHGEPLVKYLTTQRTRNYDYLATSTTGDRPRIKVWRAARDQSLQEQMFEAWSYWKIRCADISEDRRSQDLFVGLSVALVVLFISIYSMNRKTGIVSDQVDLVDMSFYWICRFFEVPKRWIGYTIPYVWGILIGGWITVTEWLKHMVLRWLDLDGRVHYVVVPIA